jgi:preprotein translocase subunit SecE
MKIWDFLKEVKSEMQKIIWPTRQETLKYTAAVIGLSLFVAAILGAADLGLLKAFETLIAR